MCEDFNPMNQNQSSAPKEAPSCRVQNGSFEGVKIYYCYSALKVYSQDITDGTYLQTFKQ